MGDIRSINFEQEKGVIMRLIIKLLLFFSIFLLLQGCAITHKFGPYRGQVLDAETEKPIEGAILYCEFYTKYSTIVDAASSYVTYREILTDAEGKFDMTYRGLIFRPGHLWQWMPICNIFKPGYATYPGNRLTTITPEPEYGAITADAYFTIRMPKLKTIKERRRNLANILYRGVKPGETRHLIRLINVESVNVGLQPYEIN